MREWALCTQSSMIRTWLDLAYPLPFGKQGQQPTTVRQYAQSVCERHLPGYSWIMVEAWIIDILFVLAQV